MLVTSYSRSGNTEEMAEEVAAGAAEGGALSVALRPVGEVMPDTLLEFDAVAIGSPVYYGTMAAQVKELIDARVAYHGSLVGKVGGVFGSSGVPGGGNETIVLGIVKALMVHGMIVQRDAEGDHYGPIAVGAPDARSVKECLRFGRRLAGLTLRLAE